MNARNVPLEFLIASFLASAIFWRGSIQYLMGILDNVENFDTTNSADRKESLSTTTIEYVNSPAVSWQRSVINNRLRRSGRLYVQIHTLMCLIWLIIYGASACGMDLEVV